MKPSHWFKQWRAERPAPWRLGQVSISTGYDLCHVEDEGLLGLTELRRVEEIREIVKWGESGEFRAVRGWGDLRRGWKLLALDEPQLLLALQWIYPSGLAWAAAHDQGTLEVTRFEATAQRQTGMYRITQIATPEQLDLTVTRECRARCLRQRLWYDEPVADKPSLVATSTLPLLCPEACNYLVGQVRKTIKGE